MDDHRISRDVFIWQTLRERIAVHHDMDEADPSLIDTLDGETSLNENLGRVAMSAKEDEAFAEGIKSMIADLHLRKSRMERRAEYKRSQIAWAMQETGQKSIILPGVTLSCREGKPKLSIDESRLSDDYRKAKVTMVIDRDAIDAAVSSGNVPEGISIANPQPVLTLRTK